MTIKVLWIFMAAVGIVFTLGFQSRSVNSGQRWLAGLNSLAIGVCNLGILKLVPSATGTYEQAAYLIGGPIGIWLAMWVHKRLFPKLQLDAKPEPAK